MSFRLKKRITFCLIMLSVICHPMMKRTLPRSIVSGWTRNVEIFRAQLLAQKDMQQKYEAVSEQQPMYIAQPYQFQPQSRQLQDDQDSHSGDGKESRYARAKRVGLNIGWYSMLGMGSCAVLCEAEKKRTEVNMNKPGTLSYQIAKIIKKDDVKAFDQLLHNSLAVEELLQDHNPAHILLKMVFTIYTLLLVASKSDDSRNARHILFRMDTFRDRYKNTIPDTKRALHCMDQAILFLDLEVFLFYCKKSDDQTKKTYATDYLNNLIFDHGKEFSDKVLSKNDLETINLLLNSGAQLDRSFYKQRIIELVNASNDETLKSKVQKLMDKDISE